MIVVTGAAGFIGSNVVAALNARHRADIVAVDRFRDVSKARPYLDGLQVQARVDKDDLSRWLGEEGRDVEAIIHEGACTDTTVTDRATVMAMNTEYTRMLWEWCLRAGTPLVYASSAATYGNGAHGYDDEADPRALEPLNLYGESKQLFDCWALKQSRTPPRWAGIKYFNVYGPHEDHKGRMASVVYHAYHQIRDTGKVRLFTSHKEGYADGGQQRDFVYVDDAVEATLHLLETPVSGGRPTACITWGRVRLGRSPPWGRRSSRRSAESRILNTSPCRKTCGNTISTSPRPRSRNCAAAGLHGLSGRLRKACGPT